MPLYRNKVYPTRTHTMADWYHPASLRLDVKLGARTTPCDKRTETMIRSLRNVAGVPRLASVRITSCVSRSEKFIIATSRMSETYLEAAPEEAEQLATTSARGQGAPRSEDWREKLCQE